MKTNIISKLFRVENVYIPNLILIDFQMVALSLVENGDFVWKMVCIWQGRARRRENGYPAVSTPSLKRGGAGSTLQPAQRYKITAKAPCPQNTTIYHLTHV